MVATVNLLLGDTKAPAARVLLSGLTAAATPRWARCRRRRMNMNQQLPVGPSCRSRDAPRAAMSSGSRKRQAPSSQGRQVRPRASSEDPDYVADALPLDG